VRRPVSRRGSIIRLRETEVEAYRFPNDRRLRGVRRFAATRFAPLIWQRWIDQNSQVGALDAATLQRRFIRYVPEYKWIIRLRAEVRSGGGEVSKQRIAVRCSSPASCHRLAARHEAVSKALAGYSRVVRVPGLVGVGVDQGLLAVEWDRGEALLERLTAADGGEAIDAFVAALCVFHSAVVPDLPELTVGGVCDDARGAASDLAATCPELADTLRSLNEAIRQQLQRIETPQVATLHNDLHVGQIHCKRGRVTILDLERMVVGDPLIDVAHFAVQLAMLPNRPEMNVERADADRWAARFLASWSEQADDPIDPRRFRAYAAASLLKLAHGSMRHLRPGWRNTVQLCVERAEEQLSGSAHSVVTG
jgi:aminoglycoside phosphotransferase (APT) family kinase protein